MADRRRGGGNRRRTAGWGACAVLLVIVAALASAAAVEPERLRPPPGQLHATPQPRAIATITAARGIPIPRSYLGLSIETWDLLRFDSRQSIFSRVLHLLMVRADGPLVLRIGGNSADRTWWDAVPGPGDRLPYRIASRWFRALRQLTVADRVRLVLDLNLSAQDPAMAGAFTRAVLAAVPSGAIEAFEVGNEPDLYGPGWFFRLAALSVGGERHRVPWKRDSVAWNRYSAALYASAFGGYASALAATVMPALRLGPAGSKITPPSNGPIPLAGPALANPMRDLGYMRMLIAADRRYLHLLTAHSYRYSACSTPSERVYPTIHRILSPAAAAGLAATIKPAVRLAARARLPFRLTELNSVSCGGRPGVSDTFATALWAPDTLFALLRAGVGGVNIHVRENRLNQAFAIGAHGLRARPLFYGLLAFARTLDDARELVPVRVRAPRRDDISVWAVRTSSGALHVLALNKGPRAVWLAVRGHVRAPATVEWLTAPGISAKGRVTLAGQRLDPAGRWIGRLRATPLLPGGDGLELHMQAYSAALLNTGPGSGAPS